MQSEIILTQKVKHYVWGLNIHIYQVSKKSKFIETKYEGSNQRLWKERMGSYCLMGTELLVLIKTFWKYIVVMLVKLCECN